MYRLSLVFCAALICGGCGLFVEGGSDCDYELERGGCVIYSENNAPTSTDIENWTKDAVNLWCDEIGICNSAPASSVLIQFRDDKHFNPERVGTDPYLLGYAYMVGGPNGLGYAIEISNCTIKNNCVQLTYFHELSHVILWKEGIFGSTTHHDLIYPLQHKYSERIENERQ